MFLNGDQTLTCFLEKAIVAADSFSRSFETQRTPERQQYRDESQSFQEQLDQQKNTRERAMEWAGENRYSLVFGSWVASMGAALGIVGRDPYMTAQQKLVQARVWAQGFTLAAVVLSLAFEGGDRMSKKGRWETVKVLDPNDPTHKHMIEKRIHHESYEGEDQWMDMVEAEEQRLKERDEATRKSEERERKKAMGSQNESGTKQKSEQNEKSKSEESKDKKMNTA